MIVHFILSGETLESLSEEIHLENPNYLKEYHNRRCAKQDYIHDSLVPGNKLLMPGPKEVDEYNARNDAPFKRPELNPVLAFKPAGFSTIFSVKIIEAKEKDGQIFKNIITYTASLKWIRKENDKHLFYLYKNNIADIYQSKMADVAGESMRSLNPLEIETDLKGKILTIRVKQGVTDNIKSIKEHLQDLFPDKYAAIYLDEFETAVMDHKLFDRRMKEDLFMKTYFAPLRNTFVNGISYFEQLIDGNKAVQIRQKVKDIHYTDEIVLLQSDTNTNFSGKYTLDMETGMVNALHVSYHISLYGVHYNTAVTVQKLV